MGIRIKNIIPVSEALTPEMVDYMTKYLSADTVVDTERLTQGPKSIESEYEEALSAPGVVEMCIQAEKDGFDAIFVNCFGDPGVRAARECVKIPVFGGFEPAVHLALGLADRISIVTVLRSVVPLISGNVARAHLGDRLVNVRNINIPVLELADLDKLCQALLEESMLTICQDRAEAIVLGCTGIVGAAERLRADLLRKGYEIPVIEAGQAAMMVCELYAKMGLSPSRITYMRPERL